MSKFVIATLNWSFGYKNPDTGAKKFYGPGENIRIPRGLAESLGVQFQEITGVKDIEEDLEVSQEDETDQESGTPDKAFGDDVLLPEDIPGYTHLTNQGFIFLTDVNQLTREQLIDLDKIGEKTADAILVYLANLPAGE